MALNYAELWTLHSVCQAQLIQLVLLLALSVSTRGRNRGSTFITGLCWNIQKLILLWCRK